MVVKCWGINSVLEGAIEWLRIALVKQVSKLTNKQKPIVFPIET